MRVLNVCALHKGPVKPEQPTERDPRAHSSTKNRAEETRVRARKTCPITADHLWGLPATYAGGGEGGRVEEGPWRLRVGFPEPTLQLTTLDSKLISAYVMEYN